MSKHSLPDRAKKLVFEWRKMMGDAPAGQGVQVLENRVAEALQTVEREAFERAISVFLDHDYDAAIAILQGREV